MKFKNLGRVVTLASLSFILANCSSRSVVPDVEELEVQRQAPETECKSLGSLTGTTMTVKGTSEEALEDMKKRPPRKAPIISG